MLGGVCNTCNREDLFKILQDALQIVDGEPCRIPSRADINFDSPQFLRMREFKVGHDVIVQGNSDQGQLGAIWIGKIKSFVDAATTMAPEPIPVAIVQYYDFAATVT